MIIQKRILFLLVMMFTVVFAYGQETDEKSEKADALCKEGVALHDEGKYEEAIKKYDEALKVKPDCYLAMAEKAYSLYSMDKKSDAKKIIEKIIKKQPTDFDISHTYLMYANILDDEGDQLKALEIYGKALESVDATNLDGIQQIVYNRAVVLSKLTDENKKKVEGWEDDMLFSLDRSLRLMPYHPRSLLLMGNAMEEHKHYLNALCCYAAFAMSADDAADLLVPVLTAWKDKELTPGSGPRTTNSLNRVKEILTKEPSEYGLLYDLFSEALPVACPDTLGMPVPVNYAADIFEDAYAPFFAELHRKGLLECFCHYVMKNSKTKYISNADWLASHKDDEERMWKLVKELQTFYTDMEFGYVPDSVVINNAEEAHQHNLDAIACCRFYLGHVSSADYMNEAAKFITHWSMASPDVTIKIGESEKPFLDKPSLLVSYLAGCSFAALADREMKPVDIYGHGIAAVLSRYSDDKETIGTIEELDKLLNLYNNDIEAFKKCVEENYTK